MLLADDLLFDSLEFGSRSGYFFHLFEAPELRFARKGAVERRASLWVLLAKRAHHVELFCRGDLARCSRFLLGSGQLLLQRLDLILTLLDLTHALFDFSLELRCFHVVHARSCVQIK